MVAVGAVEHFVDFAAARSAQVDGEGIVDFVGELFFAAGLADGDEALDLLLEVGIFGFGGGFIEAGAVIGTEELAFEDETRTAGFDQLAADIADEFDAFHRFAHGQ